MELIRSIYHTYVKPYIPTLLVKNNPKHVDKEIERRTSLLGSIKLNNLPENFDEPIPDEFEKRMIKIEESLDNTERALERIKKIVESISTGSS